VPPPRFQPNPIPPPPSVVGPVSLPPAPTVTAPQPGASGLRRQLWRDLPDPSIDALIRDARFPDAPSASSIDAAVGGIRDTPGSAGLRLITWLVPPVSGTYRFVLISGSPSELWLSDDERPHGKRRSAWVTDSTRPGERFKYPSQISPPIALIAGKRHLVEVIQVGAASDNHLTIGWLMPDGQEQFPIPGQHLILPESSLAWVPGDPSLPPHAHSAAAITAPTPTQVVEPTVVATPIAPIAPVSPPVALPVPPPVATVAHLLPPAASTGIRRAFWSTGKSNSLAEFFVDTLPDATIHLHRGPETTLAAPRDLPGPFTQRLTAYLVPPLSGVYRFAVASSEQSEVWLSPTTTLQGKRLIASVPSATAPDERDRFPSQRSPPIPLVAGQRCCIEVLHRAASANNHLAVGWTLPSGEEQFPIAGRHIVLPTEYVPWVRGDPSLPAQFPPVTVTASLAGGGSPTKPDATPGLVPGLRHERWNTIPGREIADLLRDPRFPAQPDEVAVVPSGQWPLTGVNFATRLTGWLVPTISGDYRFDLYTDDEGQLWLGSDDRPASRRLLATSTSDMTKPTISAAVRLEAGRKYYLELLHKANHSGTRAVVGWTPPGEARQVPIPGTHLMTSDLVNSSATKERPGFLRRERWNGIPGERVSKLLSHPKFPEAPDEIAYEPAAASRAQGENFGERLVGWLIPPTTGDYRFDLSSDDDGELWLSTDDRPAGLRKVAFDNAQQDVELFLPVIPLEAGRRYYVEIMHKQGGSWTYCTVGWTLPTGKKQMPIPNIHLSTTEREPMPGSLVTPPAAVGVLVDKPQLRIERLSMPEEMIDLTREGRLTWALWGQVAGEPLTVTRKAGTLASLVKLEVTGIASAVRIHDLFPVPFTWSDGDRETRAEGRTFAIFTVGAGRGFLLTLPADRLVREVHLYVGGANAAYRLDAGIEGQPPAPPNVVPAEAAVRAFRYVIRYAAGVDGRKLRLHWGATSPGNSWLAAVTVSAAAP